MTELKSIWHNADEIPEPYKSFIIKTKNGNIYTGIITKPEEWNPLILPEFYSIGDIDKADTILQYAYVDDLLVCEKELAKTKKKLDICVDALSAITATPLNSRVIHDVGNKALEQITAEQKD